MGVPKDRTQVTANALKAYADALRGLAQANDQLAKAMQEAGLDYVDATSMKTGVDGLVNIGKFLGAVTTAYCENLSAIGVGPLAGATAELMRLTNRLHAGAMSARKAGRPVDPLVEAESDTFTAEAKRKAKAHARKKQSKE